MNERLRFVARLLDGEKMAVVFREKVLLGLAYGSMAGKCLVDRGRFKSTIC